MHLDAVEIVTDVVIKDGFAGSMSMDVVGHVVKLVHHVSTHFIETGRRYKVALSVNLPSDRCEPRANCVVARSAGGGTCVLRNISAVISLHDHSPNQIGVIIVLVVHNGEYLPLNANLHVGIERIQRDNSILAKNAVVEGRLVLPRGTTHTGC